MKFNKLGDTNLDVSSICLGTMTFGEQNNQKESFEIMDYATEKGINFFDTAEQYSAPCTKDSYGRTETIIGNWFIKKNNRELTNIKEFNIEDGIESEDSKIDEETEETDEEKKEDNAVKPWENMCETDYENKKKTGKFDDLKLELNGSVNLEAFNNDEFSEFGQFNC